MSTPDLILVTGATGRHGSTGRHVVEQLLAQGRRVRALARVDDDRAAALRALGADVAIGDLTEPGSLTPALDGVDAATFAYPVGPGVVQAAASLAAALRAQNRPIHLVATSMIIAQAQSPSHLGRAQWLAEEVIAWAGVDLTVLRIAAMFFENIPLLHGHSIRTQGLFRNNLGDTPAPWMGGVDAAALVVAALLHRERFDGGPIHYPVGVERLTSGEIGAILSEELGRPVAYEAVSTDTWREDIEALAEQDAGGLVNRDMAGHITSVGSALAHGGRGPQMAPDPAKVKALTGRDVQTFRAFVRAERPAFQ